MRILRLNPEIPVMNTQAESIALLLTDAGAQRWHPEQFGEGALQLIRCADGHMQLQAVETAEEFDRIARTTGCFRRGKPIRDPQTREVIGYEMEEVPLLRDAGAP
jgi:hypothetical protein